MVSIQTMTAQRQERYGRRPGIAFFALVLAVLAAGLDSPAPAATTERVVADRYSGLAIGGFDPVAYFTDSVAVQGLGDFEAASAGVVWRFRNEGNRASFVAHPEIYGPQFGGYDPVDLSRGVTIAGNPRFFVVTGRGSTCSTGRTTATPLPPSPAASSRTPMRAGRSCGTTSRSK